jgi:hypothetical protein
MDQFHFVITHCPPFLMSVTQNCLPSHAQADEELVTSTPHSGRSTDYFPRSLTFWNAGDCRS